MSDSLTTKLLLWLYARERVESELYQQMPLYPAGSEPSYRVNGLLVSRNPREYFLDNYDIRGTEKGFISVLDEIERLKILAADQLIPLKVESSKFETMVDILEDGSSIAHLSG